MRKTIAALLVLVGILALWVFLEPRETTRPTVLPKAVRHFGAIDFDQVVRIRLEKGSERLQLRRTTEGWVLGSVHNFPARAEHVAELLEALRQLEPGEPQGRSPEAHRRFQVDATRGGTITLYGERKQLTRVVVGTDDPVGGITVSRIFVRFGDSPTVYSADTVLRRAAGFHGRDLDTQHFFEGMLLRAAKNEEVESVTLVRPGHPDLTVRRAAQASLTDYDVGDVAQEERDRFVVVSENEETTLEGLQERSAREFLAGAENVAADSFAEPESRAACGLEPPRLKAVIRYRKANHPGVKTTTLLFGNARTDRAGTSTGYFFTIDDAAHRDHVYILETSRFAVWNRDVGDFLGGETRD